MPKGACDNNLEQQARNSFLYELSRAICGKMSDKIWFNLRGERDSCKGVFDLLIRKSLSTYIGSFNTSSFELDSKSVTDPELKQKFLIKNRYSRLAISQEVSEKWLDGDLIKKVSSGGDKIDARNLFKNIETFRNSCKYMMIGNGMPRVKPVDALDNRWFYEIKAKFVNDPAQHQKLKSIQVFKADPDIKNVFCCRDDVMNAFCSIIFDAFNKPCAFPKELLSADDDGNIDPHKEAKRLFKSGDPSDILSNKELRAILNNNKDCFDSLSHMKKILKQHFAVDNRDAGGRGLKHILLND